MKNKLLQILPVLTLVFSPNINFGQAPALGTTANFALFTAVGEVKNVGISYLTHITGNCGTNNGPVNGFGNVDGVMTHTSDALSMQAETDLLTANGLLDNTTPTNNTLSNLLGSGPGQVLTAGVYSITSANISLDQNLILDAQGDPTKVFIFQLHGAFSTTANSKVKLINEALACNVFWKIDGVADMASGTSMKGTMVVGAAINMATLDTLEGRALSLGGAITVSGVLVQKPIGCSSPVLTGPSAPALGSTACYALFSSSGQVTNTGITHVTGDIGTNGTTDSATGYNPLFVTGTIHSSADGSTIACAADLINVFTYLHTLPKDIELLYPAEFGHNLTLTPHTYLLNAATSLTDTVFLNAQGNANAVFVIQISGALSTSTHSQVVLTNGTLAKNVFWKIDGAININDSSVFIGTIISSGAINLNTGVSLQGRVLTKTGDLTTAAINAVATAIPTNCGTVGIATHDAIQTNDTFVLYPNPFTTSIAIVLNGQWLQNKCELEMYNVLGAIVMNKIITKQTTIIETSNLPSGIYFYKIIEENKIIQSGRLVSQQ